MKKVFCVILVMAALLTLVACKKKTPTVSTTPSVASGGYVTSGPDEPRVTESRPTESPKWEEFPEVKLVPKQTPGVEDEYAGLEMSGFDLERAGVYLLRNDKIYTIDDLAEVKEKYPGYGYFISPGRMEIYRLRGMEVVSHGDVPVLVLEESDKIVMCSPKGDVPILRLYTTVYEGYTLPVYGREYYDYSIHSSKAWVGKYDAKSITITDSEGNERGVNGLDRGAEYTISWYIGTLYDETTLVADCRAYSLEGTTLTEIKGTLTKNGYVEFEIPELAAGYYCVSGEGAGRGIIEIR